MRQLKVRLCIIGQPPADLEISQITRWQSELWRIDGSVETFALNKNTDLEDWGYSDEAIASVLPENHGHDFTFCILNVPLEENYYARRLKSHVLCLTFYETADILRIHNIPVRNLALRMLYSFTLIYHRCKGSIPPTSSLVRYTHDETRRCTFDMNGIKTELFLSCDTPVLCESCKSKSLEENVSREFLARYEKEIKRVRKDLYYRLADKVKSRPITAIIISVIAGILVNILSSFVYDAMRNKEDRPFHSTAPTFSQ